MSVCSARLTGRLMEANFLKQNAEAVRKELARIVNSWEFYASRRMRDVLTFLVEETLADRGPEIKAYTIATEVLDRPPDFDPQTDAVVRVVVGKLRKRLDKFYSLRGMAGPIKITIPVGNYMAAFELCENAPASSGFSGSASPEPPPAVPVETENPDGDAAKHSAPTILVFPFSNLSAEVEVSHIVTGFVEEIVIGLTRFSDFRVTSANYYQTSLTHDLDPWTLARQLGARFILQGNIQVFGNSMRVRVILMDANNGRSIWAEHYDSNFDSDNVFHVLDEITNKVLAGIAGSFGFINKVLLTEVEQENSIHRSATQFSVYEAVLYYHHWIGTLNAANERKALAALEAAVEADPHYGLAKAMLADIYATSSQWCPDDAEAERLERRSLELALEAETLNPNCQYAQWAKAFNFYLRKQEREFIDTSRLVVTINPANTNLVSAVGLRLASYGMMDEGFEIIENSRKFNPFLPEWYRLATFLGAYLDGDLETALREANQIRWPGYVAGPLLRATVLGQMGRIEEAGPELAEINRLAPHFVRIGRRTLGKLYYHDRHVTAMLDGLNKAGLSVR